MFQRQSLSLLPPLAIRSVEKLLSISVTLGESLLDHVFSTNVDEGFKHFLCQFSTLQMARKCPIAKRSTLNSFSIENTASLHFEHNQCFQIPVKPKILRSTLQTIQFCFCTSLSYFLQARGRRWLPFKNEINKNRCHDEEVLSIW